MPTDAENSPPSKSEMIPQNKNGKDAGRYFHPFIEDVSRFKRSHVSLGYLTQAEFAENRVESSGNCYTGEPFFQCPTLGDNYGMNYFNTLSVRSDETSRGPETYQVVLITFVNRSFGQFPYAF